MAMNAPLRWLAALAIALVPMAGAAAATGGAAGDASRSRRFTARSARGVSVATAAQGSHPRPRGPASHPGTRLDAAPEIRVGASSSQASISEAEQQIGEAQLQIWSNDANRADEIATKLDKVQAELNGLDEKVLQQCCT